MLPDRSMNYQVPRTNTAYQVPGTNQLHVYKYIIQHSRLLTLSYNHYHWHQKQTHHDDHTVHGFSSNSCPNGNVFTGFSEPHSSSHMTWHENLFRTGTNYIFQTISSCRNCCRAHGIAKPNQKEIMNISTPPCHSGRTRECELYIYIYIWHA